VRFDSVTVINGGPGLGEWWIIDNHSTTDSIRIFDSLWHSGTDQPSPPPSTGAHYLSLVGEVQWEGRVSRGLGYILLPRNSADYVPWSQVNVTAAWPIDRTHLVVAFEQPVEQTSAETPSNYSTAKGLGISAAIIDPTFSRVTLTTSSQIDNLSDTVIVTGVVDFLGVMMTTPDSVRFWQGFTPISKVQSPDAGGDSSAILGEVVTIKGVVVADTSSFNFRDIYLNDKSDSIYNGVLVSPVYRRIWMTDWPMIGDTFVVSGRVTEYFGETEIYGIDTYRNFYLINHGPSPLPYYMSFNASDHKYDMTRSEGERLEGVFCKLCDTLVTLTWGIPDTFIQLLMSLDGTDTVAIEGSPSHMNYDHLADWQQVVGLTGIHRYRRDAWKLVPRSDADFNTGMGCGVPQIEFVDPTMNALNVPVSAHITAAFNMEIDPATVNDFTFLVNGSISGPHIGQFAYDSPSNWFRFESYDDFANGEVISVTLTTGIKSLSGVPLSTSYSWLFTTEAGSSSAMFDPEFVPSDNGI
jgi:hypothetical protein